MRAGIGLVFKAAIALVFLAVWTCGFSWHAASCPCRSLNSARHRGESGRCCRFAGRWHSSGVSGKCDGADNDSDMPYSDEGRHAGPCGLCFLFSQSSVLSVAVSAIAAPEPQEPLVCSRIESVQPYAGVTPISRGPPQV
jgi:hypothetical protein